MPPSASISLTRCPFPFPPMEGLQDICPRVSTLWGSRKVRHRGRADAKAASVPACPPPTTITSNELEFCMTENPGGRIIPETWSSSTFHVEHRIPWFHVKHRLKRISGGRKAPC